MNEQADKILSGLLQKASDGIDAAVSFSQAQVPDVVHQLLVWKFASSLLMTVIAIISIYPVYRFVMKQFDCKYVGKDERYEHIKVNKYKSTLIYDSDGDIHPGSILLGLGVLFYALFVCIAVFDLTWLQIWLAPKLYLLEYAASLVK